MAVISTGSIPKALWPGIYSFWGQKYDEHQVEWIDLFDKHNSTQAYEEDVQVTGMGLAPVKPEGSAVRYDQQLQGFTTRYTNVTYGLGFIVTREQEEDNLYEQVAMGLTARLAFSMNQTKENVHANVYNRATTAGFTGGDGVTLLNASHPTRSGNQSNVLSPAADLSEAALEDVLIDIMEAKDDLGLNISLMGRCLNVPPALAFDATRIMKSVLQSDSADNNTNAIRTMGLLPDGVKVNHYFTDTDQWFVRTNAPSGMKSFERRAIDFTQDNDFDTENHKYKATERYVPYWTDWRALFGSPGG